MKVPFSWLKEYLTLTQSVEEISEALTLAGLEVEGIEENEDDTVFEIGLTPNLGHCMSILGIARELGALLDIPLSQKKISFETTPKEWELKVDNQAPEQCKGYFARLVTNCTLSSSPDWLVKRLEQCGIRSVNPLVDVGNYVMLEWGQPLHIFDYDKLSEKHLIVRLSENDKTMETLDGLTREVPDGVLLICAGKRPVAFAGVMGDASSSVTENTSNILIEAAHFTPEAVRKTAKTLNLRTESSSRFERGIDPLMTEKALDRAAQLFAEIAQGHIIGNKIESVPHSFTFRKLTLNSKRVNRLLGTTLSIGEMALLLKKLDFTLLSESEEALSVRVPSYRNDVKAEIDLVEEVGRMYGFNNIPRTLPKHTSSTMTHAPLYLFEEEIREKMVASGLQECLTCDLISPKLADLTQEATLKRENHIHVLHPASVDQSVLRPSLLPGLLEVVKYNIDHQNLTLAAFEVGHIHYKKEGRFHGEPSLGIVLTGKEFPYHFEYKPKNVDFYDLKGHLEDLLLSLGIEQGRFAPSHLHNFHPGRQAHLFLEEVQIATLGEVHPKVLRELGIGQRVFFAEVSLHDLMDWKKSHSQAKKLSSFPGSERDWTLTLEKNHPIGPLLEEIRNWNSPLLENVYLLDLYTSEKLGKNKKNVTFRFQYRDPTKTIAYDDVEKEHKSLTQYIAEKLENSVP